MVFVFGRFYSDVDFVCFNHQVEISPLANAVESMVTKIKEIRERTVAAEQNAEQLNPLSMILNGVIDAAVMGGIAVYEEVSYSGWLNLALFVGPLH